MSKTAIIIGGGFSVAEGIEKGLWDKIRLCDIWSCNYAYKTMPYLPNHEVWVDVEFFEKNVDDLKNLYDNKVEMVTKKHLRFAHVADITVQYEPSREKEKYYGKEALKRNTIYYGRMGLSGMFALSVCVARGYDKIYLLGFDFGTPDVAQGFTHYYQNELNVYSTGVRHPEVYRHPQNYVKDEVNDFNVYLQTPESKIINVSLVSNIRTFDKISYEQFFTEMEQNA